MTLPRRTGGGPPDALADGVIVLPDGRIIDPNEPPCGDIGSRCCEAGGGGEPACNPGLDCDREYNTCCAGAGDSCSVPAECCDGLGCDNGACVSPEGGSCEETHECVDGTICDEETFECTRPDEGCGAEGEECCARDSCLTRDLSCDDSTDRCEPCGTRNEACCEGRRPCGDSQELLCLSEECVEPRNCGTPGEPCCEPDKACVFGSLCDRRTDTCTGGGNPNEDPSCGAEAQSCCANDACDSGNICEPLFTNRCLDFDDVASFVDETFFDCGSRDENCCPIGTGEGGLLNFDFEFLTCEDSLVCDFLTCKVPRGTNNPTGSTRFGTPCTPPMRGQGNPCAQQNGETVCLPSNGGRFVCCHPQGGRCTNSIDCCGNMTCNTTTKRCIPLEPNAPCLVNGTTTECKKVNNVTHTCQKGRCKPGSPNTVNRMCTRTLGQTCNPRSNTDCCKTTGHLCQTQVSGDTNPTCCVGKNTTCRNNTDCCGSMTCRKTTATAATGTCKARAAGESCINDNECDGTLRCLYGVCSTTAGCALPGGDCTEATCCGPLGVGHCNGEAGLELYCCSNQLGRCRPGHDEDCCGFMKCGASGVCICRGSGETCTGAAQCCGGSLCTTEGRCT